MNRTGYSGLWWAILGTTTGLLGIQIWHTVSNLNRWPFCSYNMFSYRLGNQATQVRVVLVTERGRVFGPDDPWGLLPVESFRVDSIMRTVFHEDVAPTVKDLFCKGVLARLNRSHWPRWDEIRSSLRPPGNDRLIALAVYLVEVDFLRSDPTDRAHVVKADLLHLFDPAGRLPPSTASSVWRFVV